MPKAFLVKKFKGSKWSAFEPKIASKRLRKVRTNHESSFVGCDPLFEVKKKTSNGGYKANLNEAHLMFFSEKPLLDLHHSTAAIRSCLDTLKSQPRARKEEGKKARKLETKKNRNYAQNVNRPLIVPNEKFEFPKPSGPLPQTEYNCKLCQGVYPDPFALAQHLCSGIKHTEYRCPECDKLFSCPANLASHRRWHRPRSPSQAIAKKNSSALSDSTTMADAVKKGHNPTTETGSLPEGAVSMNELNTSGEYVCELCDKTFRRKTYLQKHLNSHGNDRPYPCQYCGKVFRSWTNRAKHVLNHAVGSKTFSCDICGNGFPNRGSLERHSRIHNSEVYSCGKCSSVFYSAPGLTRHTMKCHNSNSAESQTALEVPVRQG